MPRHVGDHDEHTGDGAATTASGNEKTCSEVLREEVGPDVEKEAEHGAQLRREPQRRSVVAACHERHQSGQEPRQRGHSGMGVGSSLLLLVLLAAGGAVFVDAQALSISTNR